MNTKPVELSALCKSSDVHLIVSKEQHGCRFDHYLVQNIKNRSRNDLTRSIRLGLILVDGIVKKSSYRVKTGEQLTGTLYQSAALELKAQEIPLDILYEDEFILLLSKAPGMVVHPAHGSPDGTLVNALLYHCKQIADVGDGGVRPGIVHRLDKETSGIMVVAKTSRCHQLLSDAFKNRIVEKQYLTLLRGKFSHTEGRIVVPIARHPVKRKKMAVCEEGLGRYAASSYRVLEEYDAGWSLVRVVIETGRTHQIRVHMTALGHPVAGDTLYGRGTDVKRFTRQMLHAHRLVMTHPFTGKKISAIAPLWSDFQEAVDRLREEGFCAFGQ